jgi:hypothetical protein
MRRLLFCLLAASCGPNPTSVTPSKPVVENTKPPAARARWVFSAPEHEIGAKLDLGDHKTLYVGGHGRRELEEGGEIKHAQTLAEESLTGVMRDDKGRFVFVAADGDAYRSTEALGPIERVAPPRTEPLASVTTGRAAILGIGAKGLFRSADFGLTWKAVDYAAQKPYGRAASVALDSKGNGVLVHLPQRVFVTHDDGATWAPIASPAHGAASVLRDGQDRLFAFGYYDQRATLAASAFAETTDLPASIFPGRTLRELRDIPAEATERFPLYPRSQMPVLREPEPLRVLAGDRVVEIAVHDGKIDTRSAPLGDPQGTPTAQPDLDVGVLDDAHVAAWNGELAYAQQPRIDDDVTMETTLFRSKDYGATWKKETTFPGASAPGHAVFVGPRGWTFVAPTCKPKASDCKPAKIRPAGKTAFEDAGDPSFTPEQFVFDEPHNKVYALADQVYEGTLDAAKLVPVHLVFAVPPSKIVITVDEQGGLRLFEHNGDRHVTTRSRNAKGEVQPSRYVDLGSGRLAFAGRRGLSIGDHESYETNDAGDTWTRVASNGSTEGLACSAAGCLLEGAQRVGWDLPALQSTEIVRATTTPLADNAGVQKPTPSKSTPFNVACKVSGKGSTMESASDASWVDGTTPARWAQASRPSMIGDTSALGLVWADKDTVHRTQLLGAAHGAMELRAAVDERDDGIIAARYQFTRRSATGKLNPVQVELAWWSPAKPAQAHHATIAGVKAFRVARFSFSGRARVVDGGVVFQGSRDDVIHFVSDDGKQQTLAAAPFPFTDVFHSGNHWVLADSDGDVVQLAGSDDGGKTWTLHGWAFGGIHTDEGVVESIAGKAMLRAHDTLHEIAWPVTADPPAPIVIDATHPAPRCEGLAASSTSRRERLESEPITMDLAGTQLTAVDRVVHDTLQGKLCTAVLQLEQGRDREAYLYADPGGGWSGWSYREADDKTIVEPLTCK